MTSKVADRLALCLLTCALLPAGVAAAQPPIDAPKAQPPSTEPAAFRAADALGAPAWLDLGLHHRTRFEYLHNPFRPGSPVNDNSDGSTALSLRTLLHVGLDLAPLSALVELLDARAYLVNATTPVSTALINPLDLLQAHVGAQTKDLLEPGDSFAIRVGRFTMDVGSRRFVARNRFRNTVNAFTGLDAQWTTPTQRLARAFVTLPVRPAPSRPQALRDHEVHIDREALEGIFWGAFFAFQGLPWGTRLEAFALGLHERDAPDIPTRNRRIITPGLRILRVAAVARFDLELEAALQVGKSRATFSPDDTRDLDHRARFIHVALGYSFDLPIRPRVAFQYDYASGDNNPDDGKNGRFDTLFGARRFEFGPTGLYGALARSNVSSPGMRVELAPWASLSAFVGYRAAWLARAKDAWATTGVRDPTGQSGTFLGHQVEARVRFHPLPGNLTVEVGVAHMFLGQFATSAPNARANGNPNHAYGQVGLQI